MNFKKASLINAVGKFSMIFLNLLMGAILARLLSPEDYGIVAVITVFSTFFNTFSDMGFGAAIVQKKELSQDDTNNIFSFTVYVALVLAGIFLLLSYPIALFYKNDAYVSLGALLSVSLFFNAMNMVPNGIMSRDKRFVMIAVRTILVYVTASAIAIGFAYAGFRYYALAAQSILSAVLSFIWNLVVTRPKFRLRFKFESIRKVLSYSGFQFAFNIVNYFSRNLDNLLTGRYIGSAALGYYNKAYNLMLYPVNNLTGIVSPVLHPILSDYQDQPKIIYQKYIKLVKLLASLGIFIAPVCYLAGAEAIQILYGSNWGASVACFQFLSLAIIPQMINSSAGAIFQSINQTKLLFINSCINTGLTVLAILIGIFSGKQITTLSLFVAIAYNLHFITAFYMLIKLGFRLRISDFVRQMLPQLIMLIIMVAGVLLYPFQVHGIFLSAVAKGLWLGLFYLAGLLLTKEYRLLLSVVKR